jgi:hypothetical protein
MRERVPRSPTATFPRTLLARPPPSPCPRPRPPPPPSPSPPPPPLPPLLARRTNEAQQQNAAVNALQQALVICYTQAPPTGNYGMPTGASYYSAPTVGAPGAGYNSAPTVGAPGAGYYAAPAVGAPVAPYAAPAVGAPPMAYGAAYGPAGVGMPFAAAPYGGGAYGGDSYYSGGVDYSRCQPIANELASAEASSCAAMEYVRDLVRLATRTAAKRAETLDHCNGQDYGAGYCNFPGGCGGGILHGHRCNGRFGCDGRGQDHGDHHDDGKKKHNDNKGRSLSEGECATRRAVAWRAAAWRTAARRSVRSRCPRAALAPSNAPRHPRPPRASRRPSAMTPGYYEASE